MKRLSFELLEPREMLAIGPPVADPSLTITFTNTETVHYEGGEVPAEFSFPGSVGPVNVLVNPVPDAKPDYTLDEDTVLAVNAAEGVSGGLPGVVLVAGPTNGVLMLDDDGSFILAPDADWFGTDHFIHSRDGLASLATVLVVGVNDAPTAVDDSVGGVEDTPLSIDVLANDFDIDGDPLSIDSFTQPSNGVVTHDDRILIYTPDADFNGTDTFEYIADDGFGGTGTATVTIEVAAINDAPIAVPDTYSVVVNGALSASSDDGVFANDYDPDGDELAGASVTVQPTHGRLTVMDSGAFLYIPDAEYIGEDSFQYTVTDWLLVSEPALVTITIVDSNDPIARSEVCVSGPDGISIDASTGLLANDTPGGGGVGELVASLETAPSFGLMVLEADGSFVYTPNVGFVGADPFTYRATGPGGLFGEVQSAFWVSSSVLDVLLDDKPGQALIPYLYANTGGGSIYDVAFHELTRRSNWGPVGSPRYVDSFYATDDILKG